MKRLPLVLLSLAIAVVAIASAAYYRYTHPIAQTIQPTTLAATAPAPTPASTRAAAPRKPERGPATQLLDIARANDPKYPATQRLDAPVDLRYAARIVLDDPVYLDTQGNLWITRPDAPETFNFLKAGASETVTHVTRDVVAFALWTRTDNSLWLPHLVVRSPAGNGYERVDYDGRRPLPDPLGFQWERALVLSGPRGSKARVVVPTASGVCAFAFDQSPESIVSSHQRLVEGKDVGDRAVQLAVDTEGVIAYVTNAAGTRGATGVARYARRPAPKDAPPDSVEYRWTVLNAAAGWPDHILHLVPLLDGSVLQIVSAGGDGDEKDKVSFSLNSVAAAAIDENRVLALVDQLSHSDPEKRDDAFKQLTTYGPGITPLLEKSLDEQPAEAQIRIRQLLKNKIEPKLSNMALTDGRMRVVNRLPDGGVIFYAESGVAIPRADDTPDYVSPAWLSVRPGHPVDLLPKALVADLNPDKHKIIAWGSEDVIVLDPVLGPQWYLGKHLDPLLGKQHRQFRDFVGIDAGGRWVLRGPSQSAATSAPATRPATTTTATSAPSEPATQASLQRSGGAGRSTLIIDPRLPDAIPRLPAWELPGSAGKAGWDKDNWPVVFMDVKPNPIPWALTESDWRPIDEKVEKVATDAKDLPPAPVPPAAPATRPAAATRSATTTSADTRPAATQDSALPTQDLLLVTPAGDCYYDGRQTLRVIRADGTTVAWPLPEQAIGSANKPTLLRTRDGLLFLFNEPGRIVRIRPTPDDAQPFAVEAAFTRSVPTDPAPLRIWLDPADRICVAHGTNRVTVFFPVGRIPRDIAAKMRPDDFPSEEQ